MNFKRFLYALNEAASYYKGIDDMLAMSRIPITSKTSKLLGYEQTVKDVYHVTDSGHAKDMISLQGSKKHISTFTHGLADLINHISIHPDLLFVLSGTAVMNFDFDIFSHPDKLGRRWLNTRGNPKSNFLQEAMNLKVIKFMLETLGKTDDPYNIVYDDLLYKTYFSELSKKDKTTMVQMYFDKVHEMLQNKMYTKIVKEILSIDKRNSKYDEIILNNFKIKGVYSIQNGKYQFNYDSAKSDVQDLGLKYLGHISQTEFKNF